MNKLEEELDELRSQGADMKDYADFMEKHIKKLSRVLKPQPKKYPPVKYKLK